MVLDGKLLSLLGRSVRSLLAFVKLAFGARIINWSLLGASRLYTSRHFLQYEHLLLQGCSDHPTAAFISQRYVVNPKFRARGKCACCPQIGRANAKIL